MSDSEYDARYVEKLTQTEKEARHRRAVAKIAEPLLEGMSPTGSHGFSSEQFRALAQYLFESEPEKIALAMRRGRFKVSALEFVRDQTRGDDIAMMTISEFARQNGVARVTLLDRADKQVLPYKAIGNKKLFYVADLSRLLSDASG